MGDATLTGRPARTTMRALVADDDASTRVILKRILVRNLHCGVLEATDGSQVLDIVAREPVALLVLDLMMPRVGGLEVLEQLRSRPDLRALPVVVLTADRDESTVRRILALGVEDYLSKPVDLRLAVARLGRVLSRIREGAEPPSDEV